MDQHRALLRELTATDFLEKVDILGRANLPEATLKAARLMYDVSEWVEASEAASENLRAAFVLIKDVFATEDFLRKADKPRYAYYTNIRLLDRYLLSGTASTLDERQSRARKAIAIIMRDWHDFEQTRLAVYDNKNFSRDILGYTFEGGQDDPVIHIRERVRTLQVLYDRSAVPDLADRRVVSNQLRTYPSDWEYFASEPDRELSHFLCLPRSKWHDETMFLRMIHATECCFEGILASLDAIPAFVLQRNWLEATEVLKRTRYFSEFLVEHWAVFTTMPVPHFFDGFREDTGDASAIQSERFQRLDVLTRGLSKEKADALKKQPEGAKYARWSPSKFANLPALVGAARDAGDAGAEFIKAALILDRDLQKWRAKHVGIARRYLPDDAIGTGDEGVSYLNRTFASPRLDGEAPGHSDSNHEDTAEPASLISETSTMTLMQNSGPRFAAFRFGPVKSRKIKSYVKEAKKELGTLIDSRHREIDATIEGYSVYFGATPYPVRKQLRRFLDDKKLAKATAPALLLAIELRSGVLMGLHRLSSGKALTFDVASEGESFTSISGKQIQCCEHEPVLRDHKGIIASVFQGPDQRTAVDLDNREEHDELALVVMGFPGIAHDAFQSALSDARDFMNYIDATIIEELQT